MAKKKKTEEKVVPLEQVLWDCRVALRGVGSTEKNRDAVISLVFLKFASDKFEKRHEELKAKYADVPEKIWDKPAFYNEVNVFYLEKEDRWDYISKKSGASDIGVTIDKAMKNIMDRNSSLKGALPTNLFATLGATSSSLKSLIDNISKIDAKRYGEEDLIGRVYEYFLQVYAAAGKKEDGEFYTPSTVVKLIAELIEPFSGTIYDPCCGSGGMFVQSMKFVDKHKGDRKNVSILGQESNPDTWRLCKLNLAARGISFDLGKKNASTFTDDQHKAKKVDFIMANPPFNLKDWREENELTDDYRFKGYGGTMPPPSNANYAWIEHMLSKLDVNHGIAGFLLANGALSAGDVEETIRKEILEKDRVESIIVLPRNMFYSTDISVSLWILNMNKGARTFNGRQLRDRRGEVLLMDLRTWNQNVETIVIDKGSKKKKVILKDDQIATVKKIFSAWQGKNKSNYKDVPELCRAVTVKEIKDKGYSLAPSKYIEFIDHDMEIDYESEMNRIQGEMKNILLKEEESQKMLIKAFRGIGYEIN